MAEMKFSTSSSDTKEFNGKKAGKIAVIAVIAVALIIVLFNCFLYKRHADGTVVTA